MKFRCDDRWRLVPAPTRCGFYSQQWFMTTGSKFRVIIEAALQTPSLLLTGTPYDLTLSPIYIYIFWLPKSPLLLFIPLLFPVLLVFVYLSGRSVSGWFLRFAVFDLLVSVDNLQSNFWEPWTFSVSRCPMTTIRSKRSLCEDSNDASNFYQESDLSWPRILFRFRFRFQFLPSVWFSFLPFFSPVFSVLLVRKTITFPHIWICVHQDTDIWYLSMDSYPSIPSYLISDQLITSDGSTFHQKRISFLTLIEFVRDVFPAIEENRWKSFRI